MTDRNLRPHDGTAATDLWVPIDATGESLDDMGALFSTRIGIVTELDEETGHPYAKAEGVGYWEPRCFRYHHLGSKTPLGTDDKRLSIQVVNDYEGEYVDARPEDAPFGQSEYVTARNRSTREVDGQGWVALPSSHRRVIDSEDERYALALTCRSVPLGSASLPIGVETALEEAGEGPLQSVTFLQAGHHGHFVTTQDSVSVGGVTVFGAGAVHAAQEAFAAGGGASDMLGWAVAASQGTKRPPLQTTTKSGVPVVNDLDAPEPDRNSEGSVPLLNHPAGYVWSHAGQIGLLGTLVAPEGASGSYFTGQHGTPIGPLPMRYDAHVSMGPDKVGGVMYVANDAARVKEGTGKLVKGEMWGDTSRANVDTELGLETLKWRPVVRVNADLPPSKPPPPLPRIDIRPEDPDDPEDDDDDDDDDDPEKKGPKGGKPKGADPEDKDQGPQQGPIAVLIGQDYPIVQRQESAGGVAAPAAQGRDYQGPGVPCPNATAGALLQEGADVAVGVDPTWLGGATKVDGGFLEYFGHPAVTPIEHGLMLGGQEQVLPIGIPGRAGGGIEVGPPSDDPGRIGLGLPSPAGGGIAIDEAPDDGVPHGRPVPGDDPGHIPLGLPVRPTGFVGFEPGLGGDDGVPPSYEERLREWLRRRRARQAREARDRRERERIERLEGLEQEARDAGRERLAERIRRARERLERRRQRREERRQRREEYRERKRREREERRRRREERRRRRREERRRRRREREEARKNRPKKKTTPQGGYMVEVTNAATLAESLDTLMPEELELYESDEEREREAERIREQLQAQRTREEAAPFGAWNAANRPLPFFGQVGGPRSLEDWAHLTTVQLRALQRIVNGAFGGPDYLASNMAVVHKNRPGNPPAGSRLGACWTAVPNESIEVEGPVVEIVSTLEAAPGGEICARGSVLEVRREHKGEGDVCDERPLIALNGGESEAPLMSGAGGEFEVSGKGCVKTPCFKIAMGEDTELLLEVGRADPETGQVVEPFLKMGRDGVLCVFKGVKLVDDAEVRRAHEPAAEEPTENDLEPIDRGSAPHADPAP